MTLCLRRKKELLFNQVMGKPHHLELQEHVTVDAQLTMRASYNEPSMSYCCCCREYIHILY